MVLYGSNLEWYATIGVVIDKGAETDGVYFFACFMDKYRQLLVLHLFIDGC